MSHAQEIAGDTRGVKAPSLPTFNEILAAHGLHPLARSEITTVQVNVGKVCNQACHHCHVDAGPKRTESMTLAVARRVIEVLSKSRGVTAVDITGGAPELNPNFAFLVEQARALGRHVMVRCNLTVLFVEGMEWLPEFYRRHNVELVCSLPSTDARTLTDSVARVFLTQVSRRCAC